MYIYIFLLIIYYCFIFSLSYKMNVVFNLHISVIAKWNTVLIGISNHLFGAIMQCPDWWKQEENCSSVKLKCLSQRGQSRKFTWKTAALMKNGLISMHSSCQLSVKLHLYASFAVKRWPLSSQRPKNCHLENYYPNFNWTREGISSGCLGAHQTF